MDNDANSTVADCYLCAVQGTKIRHEKEPRAAAGLLDFGEMDILVPLCNTKFGNQFEISLQTDSQNWTGPYWSQR